MNPRLKSHLVTHWRLFTSTVLQFSPFLHVLRVTKRNYPK